MTFRELDAVEFLEEVEGRPVGTKGTIVSRSPHYFLVEINDESDRGLSEWPFVVTTASQMRRL